MIINILLCDTFPGLLPDYIPSYASMFTTLFNSVRDDITYITYRTMDGELPVPKADGGIYLITGCNQSAYDDTPWIKQLLRWIVSANDAHAKVVGVCFGHQCIAQALGGKVEKAPQGWGFGIRESRIVDVDTLRRFPDGRLRLMYNHHDQVTALPSEATLIATSDFCPIESFRMGDNILSFQGHPEYIPEYELHLLNYFSADEPEEVKQKARRSLETPQHHGRDVARWITDALG